MSKSESVEWLTRWVEREKHFIAVAGLEQEEGEWPVLVAHVEALLKIVVGAQPHPSGGGEPPTLEEAFEAGVEAEASERNPA